MNIKDLKNADRVQVEVDESVYGYNHIIQIKDNTPQECERCLKPNKLWFPEEDGVAGLCDNCLIESYGKNNIESINEK